MRFVRPIIYKTLLLVCCLYSASSLEEVRLCRLFRVSNVVLIGFDYLGLGLGASDEGEFHGGLVPNRVTCEGVSFDIVH